MLLTIREVCKQLDIGRTLGSRLINSDEFEVMRLGNRTLITRKSIEALIERRKRVANVDTEAGT